MNNSFTSIAPQVERSFEVQKQVGRGAYGIVYKVIEKKSRKTLALKKAFDVFRTRVVTLMHSEHIAKLYI